MKDMQSSFPRKDLKSVLEKLRHIEPIMHHGQASKEAIKKAWDGPSKDIFSSARHYGLLIGQGAAYQLTPLAIRLLDLTSPSRVRDLRTAANMPELYQTLRAVYAGKRIPEDLERVLSEEYGIHTPKEAADVFRVTMKHVGLLTADDAWVVPEGAERSDKPKTVEEPVAAANADPKSGNIIIVFPNGATIGIPQQLFTPFAEGRLAEVMKQFDKDIRALFDEA